MWPPKILSDKQGEAAEFTGKQIQSRFPSSAFYSVALNRSNSSGKFSL